MLRLQQLIWLKSHALWFPTDVPVMTPAPLYAQVDAAGPSRLQRWVAWNWLAANTVPAVLAIAGAAPCPCDSCFRVCTPLPCAEVYVDRDTFAFSRGNRLLAILTAGYANTTGPGARAAGTRPATYHLANLGPFAGQRLCDALLSGVRTAGVCGWEGGYCSCAGGHAADQGWHRECARAGHSRPR